jgi:hypothetical protein
MKKSHTVRRLLTAAWIVAAVLFLIAHLKC